MAKKKTVGCGCKITVKPLPVLTAKQLIAEMKIEISRSDKRIDGLTKKLSSLTSYCFKLKGTFLNAREDNDESLEDFLERID